MLISILFLSFQSKAQNSENWSSKQLIDPSELSSVIKAGKKIPVIFSVGPAATIPNSIDIGIVKDEANLNKFKKRLNGIQKN